MVATNAVWRKEQQASPTAPRGNEHRVRAKGYAVLVLVRCCQLHSCLPLCLHVLVVRMCAGSEEERLNEILDHLEGGAETVRAFESARARTRILLIFSRIFSCPPPGVLWGKGTLREEEVRRRLCLFFVISEQVNARPPLRSVEKYLTFSYPPIQY